MTFQENAARAEDHVPLFEIDEAVKARLRRIGVIDVGSNSIRLVVFDGMARSPAYFFNEKVLCGLGAGLGETGRLNPEGRRKALGALHRFVALASRLHLSGMIAVATAAVRDAEDGPDFCAQVEAETGLQIHVASGAEEARLSAKGVLLGWPDAEGIVCDMGGSSMELAILRESRIHGCETSPLGPLKLADFTDMEKRDKYIRKQVKALAKAVAAGEGEVLFLVGGSWRAVARLDMLRRGYRLTVLHGYEPPVEELLETLAWIPNQDIAALSDATGTSTARLSLIPDVAPVLAEVIRRLAPRKVVISAYGLREGLLYRQMPETMRERDPLIEAARHMEKHKSRIPGFGRVLFNWLKPLYAEADAQELRLIEAACLMHDVHWRAHPEYRAEHCFASVTRANIGGVNHVDRVFIGFALLNRYKASPPANIMESFGPMLGKERLAEAAQLGRAMRLGSMLSGSAHEVLESADLRVRDGVLSLTLRGVACECAGEAVERRLQGLASRMGLPAELKLEP
ncbi:exopolyphosphatase [Amaricoccus macauensis]|uniref:Ppx/GppA phosphatase family protein n=1 Tax=Amaricoccus macauensis TaxID=57001 RepID=UPI003C7A4302